MTFEARFAGAPRAVFTEKTIDHRLAWLAGIIDGEGCVRFGIEHVQHRSRDGHSYTTAGYHVDVANTDAAMLTEMMSIADILGVKYGYYPRIRGRGANDKPQHRVSFHSMKACRDILLAVLPFLVTKRPHAELMLRAIQHRSVGLQHFRKPGYVHLQDDAEFQRLAGEVKTLNVRGIRPGTVKWNESVRPKEEGSPSPV